jgi:hypothetical protein
MEGQNIPEPFTHRRRHSYLQNKDHQNTFDNRKRFSVKIEPLGTPETPF